MVNARNLLLIATGNFRTQNEPVLKVGFISWWWKAFGQPAIWQSMNATPSEINKSATTKQLEFHHLGHVNRCYEGVGGGGGGFTWWYLPGSRLKGWQQRTRHWIIFRTSDSRPTLVQLMDVTTGTVSVNFSLFLCDFILKALLTFRCGTKKKSAVNSQQIHVLQERSSKPESVPRNTRRQNPASAQSRKHIKDTSNWSWSFVNHANKALRRKTQLFLLPFLEDICLPLLFQCRCYVLRPDLRLKCVTHDPGAG